MGVELIQVAANICSEEELPFSSSSSFISEASKVGVPAVEIKVAAVGSGVVGMDASGCRLTTNGC